MSSVAMNPVINFSTLFGILAVSSPSSRARDQPGARRGVHPGDVLRSSGAPSTRCVSEGASKQPPRVNQRGEGQGAIQRSARRTCQARPYLTVAAGSRLCAVAVEQHLRSNVRVAGWRAADERNGGVRQHRRTPADQAPAIARPSRAMPPSCFSASRAFGSRAPALALPLRYPPIPLFRFPLVVSSPGDADR